MVHTNIYKLLVITKKEFVEHLENIEKDLHKVVKLRLKLNVQNYFWGRTETECLGLWIINDAIRPLASKVDVIKAIGAPTKVHHIRQFVGIIIYYRYIYRKSSHISYALSN